MGERWGGPMVPTGYSTPTTRRGFVYASEQIRGLLFGFGYRF